RAHFAIGIIYLQQGRYEPAVNELDKVGTALATRSPDQLRVAPGDPLIVRLREPNLVAHEVLNTLVEVTITAAKSGDVVKTLLLPESADSDRFNVVVQTQLGPAIADDKVLQLFGDDAVILSYKTHYLGKAPEMKTVKILTASNAQITLRDSDNTEVAAIAVGEKLTIDVNDADCDTSEGLDTLTVVLTTKQNDSETVTLTETGAHTGIFRGAIPIANGKAKPNSGVIETEEKKDIRGEHAEDGITVTYDDKLVLSALPNAEKTPPTYIPMVNIASGELTLPQKVVNDPNLGIQTMIYKGKSLTEIGTTYLDLGQQQKAERAFRGAQDQYLGLMAKYPKAPEVEEAMYGLVRNYMAQDNFPSAMLMIDQLLAKYPQSVHATDALMQLADANVKQGKYSEALVLYAKLVKAGKNGPISENAQYAICNTYQVMFNAQRISASAKLLVTVDTIIAAYEDFTISYPASDKSPDILNKLVDLQYANDDFTGVVSTARRLAARYPDSSLCGPALLRAADAQLKLGDTEGAAATCRAVIANYGNEADAAAKILKNIKAPVTTNTTSTTTTGKVD
ncbi:MAG: tetratricopeptide repeat protein, partial [bacterium]